MSKEQDYQTTKRTNLQAANARQGKRFDKRAAGPVACGNCLCVEREGAVVKAYLLLPVALLAGLVMGGMGPRSELSELRAELEKTRRLAAKGGRGGADVSGIGGLLGIERREAAAPVAGSNTMQTAVSGDTQAGSSEPVAATTATNAVPSPRATRRASAAPSDAKADEAPRAPGWDLDQAVELWQTRVAIAKSTLISNVRLNDTQALQLETTLAAMNIRIGSTIDQFAASIQDAELVQPEAGIRLANDITAAMVTAYDELDTKMPDGWRRRAGERFSLTDFIDPEVARPMVGLEGKLNGW